MGGKFRGEKLMLTEKELPIDIMIADGNPLVLSAMSEVFEDDDRFSLVATSGTSESFLSVILRTITPLMLQVVK